MSIRSFIALFVHMQRLLFVLLLISVFFAASGQKPVSTPVATNSPVFQTPTVSKADLPKLQRKEDTLKLLASTITYDTLLNNRKNACYTFIPKFVDALKTENSFYYPFDSLESISKVYAPDSTFRIFTWQLVLPKGKFRYYGVIQMKSSKLKIFPLLDLSDTMSYQPQHILSHNNWYGALYYNIIIKYVDRKPVYTLFGFEAADWATRRKVVEILSFDDNGVPRFGAPLFHYQYEDTARFYKTGDTLSRFFIEYKAKAPTVLNYDKQMEMIVFDHVAPPSQKAHGATFTYVPDGTYEGFKWNNNRWNWVEKVFTYSIDENDNPPIPAPLFGRPAKQPDLPKEEYKPK